MPLTVAQIRERYRTESSAWVQERIADLRVVHAQAKDVGDDQSAEIIGDMINELTAFLEQRPAETPGAEAPETSGGEPALSEPVQAVAKPCGPKAASYLRGQEYRQSKQRHGGDRQGSGQDGHLPVAQALGRAYGVNERTIRRDAAFSAAVDVLDAGASPGIKAKVLAGQGPAKGAIMAAAKVAETDPKRARAMLVDSDAV